LKNKRPNATENQFASIFENLYEMSEYTFVSYHEKKPLLDYIEEKIVYFVSKQSLEKPERREEIRNWLLSSNCQDAAIYVDEVHYGSSSFLAQQILNFLTDLSSIHIVFLTATYASVIQKWLKGISSNRIFTWDLEDEQMLANIDSKIFLEMVEKHSYAFGYDKDDKHNITT